jgi:hypothetical protein
MESGPREETGLDDYVGPCDARAVNGHELLRKLRRLARRRNIEFDFNPATGKGGHGLITFGDRRTLLRSSRHKEVPGGSLRGMLSDLGIDPRELG